MIYQVPTIVNIISFVSKSNAFEWVIEGLQKKNYRLIFILLHYEDSPLEQFLKKRGVTVYRVHYTGKKYLLSALLKVTRILKKEKADIVHAHLFDACMVGLLAAKLAGIKKRIYTRHNSTIHHVYYPNAVKYDRFINYMSTDILAISRKVKEIMIELEDVNPQKIHLVPHGFDFTFFQNVEEARIEKIKEKYKIKQTPVIGVISRYIHWKGIQFVIPAFKKFLQHYPNALLVLANANGPYKNNIQKELQKQLPEDSFREIEFEEDVISLFKTFDAFVHVPIDDHSEAFGQVYVEALASGIPSIFTMSGIAPEFIKDKHNALVVDFKNEAEIYTSLVTLFSDPQLYNQLKRNGADVSKEYDIEKMINKLELIYQP